MYLDVLIDVAITYLLYQGTRSVVGDYRRICGTAPRLIHILGVPCIGLVGCAMAYWATVLAEKYFAKLF